MAYTTINKPSDYFNTKLYTGTGASNSVDVGFQTDFTWIKDRDSGAAYHYLYDTARGAGKAMYSNDISAEATNLNNLASFDASGFTLGTGGGVNASGDNFVSWNWLAGGTGVSNTQGSIASTVSANTTSGFSIVSYTGNGTDNATVGHGLSQKPDMVIIKARENTSSWVTWHKDLTGSDYLLFLDATDAQSQYTTILKNQSSSVLTLGTNSATNASGQGFISYNFHSVKGFSKFGSYTGNGSADGPFIYTGFKPAFIIVKRTDAAISWTLIDNKRDPYNVTDKRLFPDDSGAEVVSANGNTDFLSNGIKIRTSHIGINPSGGTYIYMAFAENPIVTSTKLPATAR